MSEQFLYEKIDAAKEFISLPEIPEYITSNLSSNIMLREYQKEAMQNTLLYLGNSRLSKNKQTHFILFFTLHQHICFSVRCSSDFRTGVALGSPE